MVATKLANMEEGRPRQNSANLQSFLPDVTPQPAPVSVKQAAGLLNVSERSVATACKVQETGSPELITAVEAGKVSISAAATAPSAALVSC